MIGAAMVVNVDIPGREPLALEHLVLDINGTLTDRGTLIEGVRERLESIAGRLHVHLLSADTYGTLGEIASDLGASATAVATGSDKAAFVRGLGTERCAAIGNGANDAAMLALVALGIAIVGREGAAGVAVRAADIVCGSILDALDLLLDERALVATLRV
jgi:soluble P-type ATPase